MPVVFFSLPWIQCFGQNFLMDNNVFYFSTSLREDAIILPLFVFSVLRATYFKYRKTRGHKVLKLCKI